MDAMNRIVASRDLAFDPPPYRPDTCDSIVRRFKIDDSHRALLQGHNGLYAFTRALHIYGCAPALPFNDLEHRNELGTWRRSYGKGADGLTFFAEEVFGNQYAYTGDSVVLFDLETAEQTVVARDFSEWMSYVVADTAYATGSTLAEEWEALHGLIPYGSHLCPKQPFAAGGEFAVENLFLIPWDEGLAVRSRIAEQIRELPEGTPIVLKLED